MQFTATWGAVTEMAKAEVQRERTKGTRKKVFITGLQQSPGGAAQTSCVEIFKNRTGEGPESLRLSMP